MKKRYFFASLILSIPLLTSCGMPEGYRYPCQDPANWDNKECNVPTCIPDGSCTKDLIGKDAWDQYQQSKGKTKWVKKD